MNDTGDRSGKPGAPPELQRRRPAGDMLWKFLISLAIPLVILPLLVRAAGGMTAISDEIRRLSVGWLLIAFLIGAVLQLARAWRFQLLFGERIAYSRLLPAVCIHYLFNRLLPMRTGEISFVIMVRRWGKVSLSRGALSLILARLLDLAVLCLFFCVSALIVLSQHGERLMSAFLPVTAAAMIMLAGITAALLVPAPFFALIRLSRRLCRNRPRRPWAVANDAIDRIEREHQKTSPVKRALLALSSLIVWALLFSVTWSILRAMGINYPIPALITGSTFAQISGVLPISGFGGFGSMELLWSLGYRMIGVGATEAVAAGLSVNVVSLLITALLAAIAALHVRLSRYARAPGARPPPRAEHRRLDDRPGRAD